MFVSSTLACPPSFLPCLSGVIWSAVVYRLGFVVCRDNRSTVWLEETDEWCSLSRTKHPPLHFIDVLMRLSWPPSEFVLYTVVGLQAGWCTWMLNAEKGFHSFLQCGSRSHSYCTSHVPLLLPRCFSNRHSKIFTLVLLTLVCGVEHVQ